MKRPNIEDYHYRLNKGQSENKTTLKPYLEDLESYIDHLEGKDKIFPISDVSESAYILKVEGRGQVVVLGKNISDVCDKLDKKGIEGYAFIHSSSLEVI